MAEPKSFREIAQTNAPIVSMINYNDRVLVATTEDVYEIRDGKLIPLRFEPWSDKPTDEGANGA